MGVSVSKKKINQREAWLLNLSTFNKERDGACLFVVVFVCAVDNTHTTKQTNKQTLSHHLSRLPCFALVCHHLVVSLANFQEQERKERSMHANIPMVTITHFE